MRDRITRAVIAANDLIHLGAAYRELHAHAGSAYVEAAFALIERDAELRYEFLATALDAIPEGERPRVLRPRACFACNGKKRTPCPLGGHNGL